MEMMQVPRDLLEQVANMRFDDQLNARLQDLMDRNNFGRLSDSERAELSHYARLNQMMTILRGRALIALGQRPS